MKIVIFVLMFAISAFGQDEGDSPTPKISMIEVGKTSNKTFFKTVGSGGGLDVASLTRNDDGVVSRDVRDNVNNSARILTASRINYISGSHSMTIWLKASSYAHLDVIFYTTLGAYRTAIEVSSTNFRVWIGNASASNYATVPIPDITRWRHLAFSCSSGTVRYYLDGAYITSYSVATAGAIALQESGNWYIGENGGGAYWGGMIGLWKFFDYPITKNEAVADYALGIGKYQQ